MNTRRLSFGDGLLYFWVGTWLLCLLPECAFAQQLAMPAVPVTVEARVRDPEGTPVQGATVTITFPRYAQGENYHTSNAVTNREGAASVSGLAQQDFIVTVTKEGYYRTDSDHHDVAPNANTTVVHKMELELRPVLNPVQRPLSRWMRRLRLPATHQALGFDLEVGDWIAPHGRGRIADFIFTVDGYFRSLKDFDEILKSGFSQPGDGIQVRKYPEFTGPALKFPYTAPETGYESERVWRRSFDGGRSTTTFDGSGETNYIFRVRAELDNRGRVRRALYGVIFGEIQLVGNPQRGRYLNFTYALNPDWTPNIEFDPATVEAQLRMNR